MSRAFFDTNILLYGYHAGDLRQSRAAEIVLNGGAISVQCLNEFAAVATRKLKMSRQRRDEALSIIVELCDPILPLTLEMHRLGIALSDDYRLSIYDGMIVAAALIADCDTLYSEDMQDGLVVDGRLRIVNPFKTAA